MSALVVQRRWRTEQEDENGVRKVSKRESVRDWKRVAAVWNMSCWDGAGESWGVGVVAVERGVRRLGVWGRRKWGRG